MYNKDFSDGFFPSSNDDVSPIKVKENNDERSREHTALG